MDRNGSFGPCRRLCRVMLRGLPPSLQGRTGEDPIESAALQAMQQKELLAAVESKTLDSRLYDIYSAARLGLEEGGANTLYRALAFLH